AASTIPAGELVTRRILRPRAAKAGLRAISIPIDPARAVGGRTTGADSAKGVPPESIDRVGRAESAAP
ncbi:MAG TPA: hypothetical protein VGA62_04280, partial [Acidimicrobiia bacterium]